MAVIRFSSSRMSLSSLMSPAEYFYVSVRCITLSCKRVMKPSCDEAFTSADDAWCLARGAIQLSVHVCVCATWPQQVCMEDMA
eukprot:4610143-Pyramimonas_sp.AAC.1